MVLARLLPYVLSLSHAVTAEWPHNAGISSLLPDISPRRSQDLAFDKASLPRAARSNSRQICLRTNPSNIEKWPGLRNATTQAAAMATSQIIVEQSASRWTREGRVRACQNRLESSTTGAHGVVRRRDVVEMVDQSIGTAPPYPPRILLESGDRPPRLRPYATERGGIRHSTESSSLARRRACEIHCQALTLVHMIMFHDRDWWR